ncbi:MAG: hypothetical protein VX100_06180 [Pseudomonadota bacterium]|nr:hypothetical protein [Pseudomonadota bacterium]
MKEFSKSFFNYSFANVLSLVLGLFLLFILSTKLEPQIYGEYGFYISIFSILLVLINWGSKERIYRFALKYKATPKEFMKKQVSICNFILIIFLPLVFVNVALYAVILFSALFSIFQCNCFLERGRSHFFKDAMATPIYRLLISFIIVGLLFCMGSENIKVSHLIFASCFCIFIVNVFFLKVPTSFFLKPIKIPKWNFFIAIELISIAYLKVDVIIGSFLLGFEQIASYFFSIQVFEAVLVLLLPICHIFIGKVKRNSSPHYELKYALMVVAITLFGLSVFLLIGDYFINAWLPHYQNAFYFIAALIVVAGIATLNSFYSMLLILKNKERVYFKIVLYCFTGYIVITPPLALFYSVKGLVIGKLLIETLIFVGTFICYRQLNNENCL